MNKLIRASVHIEGIKFGRHPDSKSRLVIDVNLQMQMNAAGNGSVEPQVNLLLLLTS